MTSHNFGTCRTPYPRSPPFNPGPLNFNRDSKRFTLYETVPNCGLTPEIKETLKNNVGILSRTLFLGNWAKTSEWEITWVKTPPLRERIAKESKYRDTPLNRPC